MSWGMADEKRFISETAYAIDHNKDPLAVARHGRGSNFIRSYRATLEKRMLDFSHGPFTDLDRATLDQYCAFLLFRRDDEKVEITQ